jgi:hypothetical protein
LSFEDICHRHDLGFSADNLRGFEEVIAGSTTPAADAEDDGMERLFGLSLKNCGETHHGGSRSGDQRGLLEELTTGNRRGICGYRFAYACALVSSGMMRLLSRKATTQSEDSLRGGLIKMCIQPSDGPDRPCIQSKVTGPVR